MNGHGKSVVMTFVVALAVGAVAEARGRGSAGRPRGLGALGHKYSFTSVTLPHHDGLKPGARLNRQRIAEANGNRLLLPAVNAKRGIIYGGSDTLKRGFSVDGRSDLKPGAANYGHGEADYVGRLYDSPGDDTFGPKVQRKRFLLGVGDGFAVPDMRVRTRSRVAAWDDTDIVH